MTLQKPVRHCAALSLSRSWKAKRGLRAVVAVVTHSLSTAAPQSGGFFDRSPSTITLTSSHHRAPFLTHSSSTIALPSFRHQAPCLTHLPSTASLPSSRHQVPSLAAHLRPLPRHRALCLPYSHPTAAVFFFYQT